jgi:hypothetical protein
VSLINSLAGVFSQKFTKKKNRNQKKLDGKQKEIEFLITYRQIFDCGFFSW